MSNQDQVRLDSKTGKPFKTEELAEKFIKEHNLNEDVWGISPLDGGFAVVTHRELLKRAKEEKKVAENLAAQNASKKKTKYFIVTPSPKGHANDLDKVPIGLEGKIVYASRGEKVILSENEMEILDHATFTDWKESKDRSQAVVSGGQIMRFPYTIGEESTKEAYDKQLAFGNQETLREVARQASER